MRFSLFFALSSLIAYTTNGFTNFRVGYRYYAFISNHEIPYISDSKTKRYLTDEPVPDYHEYYHPSCGIYDSIPTPDNKMPLNSTSKDGTNDYMMQFQRLSHLAVKYTQHGNLDNFKSLIQELYTDKELASIHQNKGHIVDKRLRSLLSIAVINQRNYIRDYLLKLSIDIDAHDDIGNTPLMYAVLANDRDSVNKLLLHGADPEIKNSKGKNAYDIAKNLGDEYMIKQLKAATTHKEICVIM
ncbi:MAG: ankyrin repeat domain-containing protein [Pseudomonadota bacterium]